MTLTHLDLDRIEGLAGRLTAARSRFAAYTDTPSVVYAVPGTDRLAVLRDDVLMAQYRLAEAASDLTAMITYIRELEGALDKLRSYSVDIEAGRINYRPLDHIAVADAALQRKTS